MASIKLVSADLSYNYVEPGDKLYITATFEQIGKERLTFQAYVVADICFCGRHRREAVESENFRFTWKPFPSTLTWKQHDVWSTTGVWNVPTTWGGSFAVALSLEDEAGENIPFIGKDGKSTFSQKITEIDIGWGWGRKRLIEQRNPVSVLMNESEKDIEKTNYVQGIQFGDFVFQSTYPAIIGYKREKWTELCSIVTVRNIAENKKYYFVGEQGLQYSIKTDSVGELVYYAKNDICSFGLHIQQKEYGFSMFLSEVYEKEGYELLEIEIPALIQLLDENGSLINYYGGGRKVSLKNALPQATYFYYDVCNALGACSENGSFAVVTNDVDNILLQSVVRRNQRENQGMIGVVIRNKISANREGMKSIPVCMQPLEVHCDSRENWKLTAEILRDKLTEIPSKNYEGVLVYKIAIDTSGQFNPKNPVTFAPVLTLADVKKMIQNVYHLSQGMRQVIYLVGWQKGGHDFEYPYPYLSGFNDKCGTLEEFRQLCEECKQYNAELSLHDNFDDAYLSDNYKINPELLAVDEMGHEWKGWLWAGGMSYIISPTAYVRSEDIKKRIKAMLADYGISETYHIDVLTSEIRRYSYAETERSCAQQNIEAKKEMIRMFNEQGIDITSETLAFPFIGKIGYAQNTRYKFDTELFAGETVVPLTTLAFHGITPYKMGADGEKQSLLRSIACGASCSLDVEGDVELYSAAKNICRNIYLVSIPMRTFTYKKVTNLVVADNVWTVEYEGENRIIVDFAHETYEIVCAGTIVSKNFTTFAQLDDEKYCYYTIEDQTTVLDLPKHWKKIKVSLILPNGGRKDVELERKETGFVLEANSDVPYIIQKL